MLESTRNFSNELIKQEEERCVAEGDEEIIPEAPIKFTVKKLAEAFGTINTVLEAMDANYERFARADKQIQDALAC